jgi:hypothetical protein
MKKNFFFKSNLSIESMNQNGVYVPTPLKFWFDTCSIMGRSLNRMNPFLQAIVKMAKKTAKLPYSCPIKKVDFDFLEKRTHLLKVFHSF